jgi:ferredoxin-NADP reductase
MADAATSSIYTMLELGAGWGPWMSITGVAAKKNEIKQINLIGVEGAKDKIPFIKKHLTEKNLRPESDGFETTFSYSGVI